MQLAPPLPPGRPPFLVDLDSSRLPSKEQACGHCGTGDGSSAPRLPQSCCGVCQFDGRLCGRLYRGENRSELALTGYMAQGHPLQVRLAEVQGAAL